MKKADWRERRSLSEKGTLSCRANERREPVKKLSQGRADSKSANYRAKAGADLARS